MLDLTGKRFQKLVCLRLADEKDKHGNTQWVCRCDCGNICLAAVPQIRSGYKTSCGCLQQTQILENMKFVGGTSVASMEARMTRPPIASNTSGHNGVYLNKKTGKWTAQIGFRGKTYYLGSYVKIEDAIKARNEGEKMYEEFLDRYYSSTDRERSLSRNEQKMFIL